MAKSVPWSITSFSASDALRLVIDEKVYSVVQYMSSNAMDEIPRASCLLALGRNARDGNAEATIHDTASELKLMLPAQVLFKPSGQWKPGGGDWPDEAEVIFDGFFTGFAFTKAQGRIQVVARLIHWSVLLGFSSTLSRSSHPGNYAALAYEAIHNSVGTGSTNRSNNLAHHIGHELLSANVEDDVWGSLKDFLCSLSEQDLIRTGNCGLEETGVNEAAKGALSKFEGGFEGDCIRDYKYAVPLRLPDSEITAELAESVSLYINQKQVESFSSMTFWDLIVKALGPTFMFKTVPMADRALTIAYTPGLRETWNVEINPEDYSSLSMDSVVPRPLRAVGVYTGSETSTGATGTQSGTISDLVVNCFAPNNADQSGLILFVSPPPWLATLPTILNFADSTTGVPEKDPSRSILAPKGAGTETDRKRPAEILSSSEDIFERYAQSVYIQEMLRGRTGTLSGKLRFDIAPGSNIRIKGTSDQFLGGIDDLAAALIGTVVRVTTAINAEAKRAETTFQMTHLRTEAENEDDRTSTDQHPIYGSAAFKGAPMIPNYCFDCED